MQPQTQLPQQLPRTYSKERVLELCDGISWRTLGRWVASEEQGFPAPRWLSPQKPVFLADAVDAWLLKSPPTQLMNQRLSAVFRAYGPTYGPNG